MTRRTRVAVTGGSRTAPTMLASILIALLAGGTVTALQPGGGETPAESGASLYARHCSVCHGTRGGGLDEARMAFPTDHRRCERCHRPGNPAVMDLSQVEARQHDLFSIGDAPALVGEGSLVARSGDPAAIGAYLKATMPRYQPGSLEDEEYAAIARFLLDLDESSASRP